MSKIIFCMIGLLFSISMLAQNQRHTIDSLKKGLEIAKDKDKPILYITLADEYHTISGDTTILYARKGLELAKKFNNREMEGKALVIIGTIEKDRGAYPQALAHYLEGLKLVEPLGREKDLAKIYNSMGILYKKMRRWDEALVNYKKANQIAVKYKNLVAASFTYNNIGTIYLEKAEWDKTMLYYDSALKYAELAGDGGAMATVLSNLGDTYKEHKKYDTALATFKRCLDYDKANEDQYGIFMSYSQIARVYIDLKNYPLADIYADSAENIATQAQFKRELIDLYAWRSTAEEEQGKSGVALDYYRRSRMLNDSLLTEETTHQISELQTQYETEKKEQQIALQKAQLNNKNYIIIAISGILSLVMLLGFSSYRRYKLKQQTRLQTAVIRQQELATQAVIEAEERERKRIAGDLHDGVGQVMSAARMNLSVIADGLPFVNPQQKEAFEKAVALVDEGCKEVRNVSHNIMPNALLKTGLTSAIRDFVQKIDHRALEVNLYTDGLNERLPANIEIVLYRVVQECVNNVIKHSGANTLDISLVKDEEGVSITIEDNGKGFDIVEAGKKEGIGLQNLQTRINYLKGTIEWDTAPGKGTVVTILVPGV